MIISIRIKTIINLQQSLSSAGPNSVDCKKPNIAYEIHNTPRSPRPDSPVCYAAERNSQKGSFQLSQSDIECNPNKEAEVIDLALNSEKNINVERNNSTTDTTCDQENVKLEVQDSLISISPNIDQGSTSDIVDPIAELLVVYDSVEVNANLSDPCMVLEGEHSTIEQNEIETTQNNNSQRAVPVESPKDLTSGAFPAPDEPKTNYTRAESNPETSVHSVASDIHNKDSKDLTNITLSLPVETEKIFSGVSQEAETVNDNIEYDNEPVQLETFRPSMVTPIVEIENVPVFSVQPNPWSEPTPEGNKSERVTTETSSFASITITPRESIPEQISMNVDNDPDTVTENTGLCPETKTVSKSAEVKVDVPETGKDDATDIFEIDTNVL